MMGDVRSCVAMVSAILLVALFAATVDAGDEVVQNGTMEDLMADVTKFVNKNVLPTVMQVVFDPNINTECSGALMKIGMGVLKGQIWAMKLVDSMARPAAGVLEGALGDDGMYEECLKVRAYNTYGEETFRGQHCRVHFLLEETPFLTRFLEKLLEHEGLAHYGLPNVNFTGTAIEKLSPGIPYGVCIPSTCAKEDLQYLINFFLGKYSIHTAVTVCATDGPIQLDSIQAAALCFMGILLFLVSFGTAVHVAQIAKMNPVKEGTIRKVITSFSIIKNTSKLFYIKPKAEDESYKLRCIHGIRVVTSLWVVLGHTYSLTNPMYMNQGFNFFRLAQSVLFCFVTNAFLSMESFFFMSGFLGVYLSFDRLRKVKRSPFLVAPLLLIRRYIRLMVPMLAFVGLFYLLPVLAPGPLTNEIAPFIDTNWRTHWWKYVLLIMNYWPMRDQSLVMYWYLCVDFQIGVLLLLILLFMVKYPKTGLSIMVLIIIGSSLSIALRTYLNGYDPQVLYVQSDITKILEGSNYILFTTDSHLGPGFVGALTGYIVLKYKQTELGYITQGICWLLSLSSMLAVLLGMYPWNNATRPDPFIGALFAGTHRIAWCVALGWIVYACVTKRGGVVNKILSHKILIPFSRLSFGLYLMHIFLLMATLFTRRERISLNTFLKLKDFFGITVLSYMASYLFYVCLEVPVGRLEKMVFFRESNSDDKPSAKKDTNAGEFINNAPFTKNVSEGTQHWQHESNNGTVLLNFKQLSIDRQNENNTAIHI